MVLITAALRQELRAARALCGPAARPPRRAFPGVVGERNGREFAFLRTGVGPVRASGALRRALALCRPELVLSVGFAGALDPALEVGDIVAVSAASMLVLPSGGDGRLDEASLSGRRQLERFDPASLLPAAGRVVQAELLTAPCIIGDRDQKRALYERFGAAAVDMETAALAAVAEASEVRFAGIRSVSDTASDDFLSPFSFDPSAGVLGRAARVVRAGHWMTRVTDWRERASKAAASLRAALEAWIDALPG